MLPSSLLVFLLLAIPACLALDYYKILDVSRDADLRTIKKQYRKLSRKYHPDKNSDSAAEHQFMEVGQAFEVLSDEDLRAAYDRGGEEAVRRRKQGQGEGHGSPFDLFSHFFGGGGGRRSSSGGRRKGPNMVTEVEVDLADIYVGKSLDLQYPVKRICETCKGSGARSASDIVTCSHCDGHGMVLLRHQLAPGMFTQMQQPCQHCSGTGKHTKKTCSKCRGSKVLQVNEDLAVDIDRGLPEGTDLVFEGEADESPDWQAGDIVVRVKSQDHAGGFTRKGSNLYYKLVLNVEEALLGFERKVKALDGHWLTLRRQGTTQPGEVEAIVDEGMPHYHGTGHGSLFVTYQVVLPSKLSSTTQNKLEDAFGRSKKEGHSEL